LRHSTFFIISAQLSHGLESGDAIGMVSRFWQWSDAINNELHVLINHAYALKDAAKAHIDLEGRATTGPLF
jgi:hypothetical protein